jgi:signal transduction histidine kinase
MPPIIKFSVDTHVFRELGELLVGRDSTALLELIKNAYDADATRIVVTATELGSAARGRVVIEDDGCGMDADRFKNGFLRIASRFKEEGTRRSAKFHRRYTGSKGIGRLAAHKLAKYMQVDSINGTPGSRAHTAILATIDWERIEKQPTLDTLTNEIELASVDLPRAKPPGTVVTLSRLRRPWSDRERVRFVTECRSFQIPDALRKPLPTRILRDQLLFDTPVLRDATNADPGCEIVLDGDFAEGDDYWVPLVDATNWVLEIDCKSDKGIVRYGITPTKKTVRRYPQAKPRTFEHSHPHPKEGPFFQARILARDEQIHDKTLLNWSRQTSGVRVYMEGFRVLPYGDLGDDWLQLNAKYSRRSWPTDDVFAGMVEDEAIEGEAAGDWQLLVQANNSYTGAVFLTQEDAPGLRMLVNREGFVSEEAYDTMVKIVERGIDLLIRTRAAASLEARKREREQREQRRNASPPPVVPVSPVPPPVPVAPVPVSGEAPTSLADATTKATEIFREARQLIATAADPALINQRLEFAQAAISQVVTAADRVRDSAAMLRVLASLGTQMAGFVHEIRGLLGTATAVHEAIERLRTDRSLPRDVRLRLGEVNHSLGDLRRQIERQAAYLVDLTATDARRRRTRMKLAERFDAAARLASLAADRRGISVRNEVPATLKSPPMFPAELTTVLSNLLSNAVKAGGEGGTIHATGELRSDGGVTILVENTGVAVDLADAERWFLPFESTTAEMDSSLGYGMGLGLTITRDMLEQYGATVRFVPPGRGFATAVEVRFPEEGASK